MQKAITTTVLASNQNHYYTTLISIMENRMWYLRVQSVQKGLKVGDKDRGIKTQLNLINID